MLRYSNIRMICMLFCITGTVSRKPHNILILRHKSTIALFPDNWYGQYSGEKNGLHHAYCTFPDFRGISFGSVHYSILSRKGASDKPGAVHTAFCISYDSVLPDFRVSPLIIKTTFFEAASRSRIRASSVALLLVSWMAFVLSWLLTNSNSICFP